MIAGLEFSRISALAGRRYRKKSKLPHKLPSGRGWVALATRVRGFLVRQGYFHNVTFTSAFTQSFAVKYSG